MKAIVLLCVFLSLFTSSAPAQNPPRPVDPPELIARRAEQLRAISRAQIQPLETYLRALESLRQQFAREGKAESAAAVDAEIRNTRDQLAAAEAASNPTTSAPAQLQIESATYGHAPTNRMADVTAAIRSAVESDVPPSSSLRRTWVCQAPIPRQAPIKPPRSSIESMGERRRRNSRRTPS